MKKSGAPPVRGPWKFWFLYRPKRGGNKKKLGGERQKRGEKNPRRRLHARESSRAAHPAR